MTKKGWVSLVGAGPGDPGLITLKAMERIKEADVIVYDRLVNPVLLDHARADCEIIFVGKGPGQHTLEQEEINGLLVARAREEKNVVRLKGGDPFIFGRGGEEALALARAGISFEVVPGVSSATAVPAYAGIPITHRGLSSSVVITTGHEDPTKEESSTDWGRLAQASDTLVILMGVGNLKAIVDRLVSHGRSPQTPIALIRWGTTAQQSTLQGTLEDIADKVERQGFPPPVVAVIGEVVNLRQEVEWYEARPLFGKRVLVTRSRQQASALSGLLAREGAEVIELPAIEIHRSQGHIDDLEHALGHLSQYQWIVFTSVNGVEALFDQLQTRGLGSEALANIRICAIGPATARAVEARGSKVHLVPPTYVAEAILEELKAFDLRGARFLLPRAQDSRPLLAQGLRRLGALVDEVQAYRAASPSHIAAHALERLTKDGVDIVTFASSSTVKNLVQMLNGNLHALNGACIACIGPITAATAREMGLKVDVVSSQHTIPALVEAIVQHVRSRS